MKKMFLAAVMLSSGYLLGMENDPDIIALSNMLSQCPTAYTKVENFIKKIESNQEALKLIEQSDAEQGMAFAKTINQYKYAFSRSSLNNSTKNSENISKEDEDLFMMSLEILHNTIDSVIEKVAGKTAEANTINDVQKRVSETKKGFPHNHKTYWR